MKNEVNTISFLKRKWQQTKTVFWPQVMKVKPPESVQKTHCQQGLFLGYAASHYFWLAFILNPLNHSFPL